ncbi:PAS domain-containing protein [Kordiimonas sp.]|uniref:PAS domain-containing protein n=1 Tax=Kordiimonas sp. TaxID=1970157 RepID=UPI003A9269C1
MLESFEPFLAYWQALRGSEELPCREDFHPVKVKDFMGRIVIVERLSTSHFQVRLVGTEIVERLGHDHTGEDFLSLLDGPEERAGRLALFNAMLDQPMGMWGKREVITDKGTYMAFFLQLPIRHKASHAGEFFNVFDFDQNLVMLSGVKFKRFGKLVGFGLIDIGAGVPEAYSDLEIRTLAH